MSLLVHFIAQAAFFITGPPMVLLAQYETYIGGNNPWSFAANIAEYGGMILFSIAPIIIDYFQHSKHKKNKQSEPYKSLLRLTKVKIIYIFPIALSDVLDAWAATYAYNTVGAAIYIVIYSSVTIFTGLIRKFYLKKDVTLLQWLAIIIITIGLAVTSIDAELKEFNMTLVLGILATLISALLDSIMYVFSERALSLRENPEIDDRDCPTTWDITMGVGLMGSGMSLLYIASYTIAGQWYNFIRDPMEKAPNVIVSYWALYAITIGAHYVSFYYVVELSSSVTAAVNKAVQSVLCFFTTSFVFCSSHHDQCATWIMGVSAVVVNIGTVLYAYGKPKVDDKHNQLLLSKEDTNIQETLLEDKQIN